jgi:hypothetical protein
MPASASASAARRQPLDLFAGEMEALQEKQQPIPRPLRSESRGGPGAYARKIRTPLFSPRHDPSKLKSCSADIGQSAALKWRRPPGTRDFPENAINSYPPGNIGELRKIKAAAIDSG